MRRRTALATAAALTIVLLAAIAAVATNMGLLQVSTDTGQVGRLSPADLTQDQMVQQTAPAGVAASSDGGSVGAQGPAEEEEPGQERSGDDIARGGGSSGGGDGRVTEHFQGREDDD